MSMTNQEILKLVKSAKKNVKDLTHITDKKNLTFEDKLKISLCKHFVMYMNENKKTLTGLSKELNMPKPRVSEIVNYKIKKYTLGKLMENVSKLAEISPQTREYLNFIGEAFEVPTMKVSDTQKLTKKIKDIQINGGRSTYLHF